MENQRRETGSAGQLGAMKVQEVGQVRNELNFLAESISVLDKELGELDQYLIPLIQSLPSNPKEDKASLPSFCQLAETIRTQRFRIDALIKATINLRQSIQL